MKFVIIFIAVIQVLCAICIGGVFILFYQSHTDINESTALLGEMLILSYLWYHIRKEAVKAGAVWSME